MNEADIYRITRMLPWGKWFSPTLTIRVNVAAITCPLRSLDFITLKIKDAICDKFHDVPTNALAWTQQPRMSVCTDFSMRKNLLYV